MREVGSVLQLLQLVGDKGEGAGMLWSHQQPCAPLPSRDGRVSPGIVVEC